MNEIIQYVKFWLIKNRPELKSNDRDALALGIYQEKKSEIENLEEGARVIYIQEFLNLKLVDEEIDLETKGKIKTYFSHFLKGPI